MGLQKYRIDVTSAPDAHGVSECRTDWMGGRTLAALRNCPIHQEGTDTGLRRTVYITGEPDSYFSIPAACRIDGCDVRGWVSREDSAWRFNAPPAVNLDCMTREDVAAFAKDRSRTFLLRAYARQKAAAMHMRAAGDVCGAMIRESHCERMYSKLPAILRW